MTKRIKGHCVPYWSRLQLLETQVILPLLEDREFLIPRFFYKSNLQCSGKDF
jgi:hypothetical protein